MHLSLFVELQMNLKYIAYFLCKNKIRESELNLVKKKFRNLDYYEITGKFCEIIRREFIENPPNYTDAITFVLTADRNFVYRGKSDGLFKVALFYHTKKNTNILMHGLKVSGFFIT